MLDPFVVPREETDGFLGVGFEGIADGCSTNVSSAVLKRHNHEHGSTNESDQNKTHRYVASASASIEGPGCTI